MNVPEKCRVTAGMLASTSKDGNNGHFQIPNNLSSVKGMFFDVMASDGMGWEHVSVKLILLKKKKVRLVFRVPNWAEMCRIKEIFWGDDVAVVQYHPAKKDYVNTHPYVLHLWRPTEEKLPNPNMILV